jgi:hypothetical protein
MKTIYITALALLALSSSMLHAQSLIGGSGTCKTNGDPDLILDLQDINQRYTCSQAWDTINNVLYVYDAGAALGQRWSPLPGDNLGNHSAIQVLDMNRFQIQECDAVTGGVDVGNNDNVAKISFNNDIGSTVPANAMTVESNAGLMITSDRNNNAVNKDTEPIIFSQGSINSDDPGFYELLRLSEDTFKIGGSYNLAMTAPPGDGSSYVQSWTDGVNAWTNTSSFGGGSGGIFEVENTNTLASDNTTNNYHVGSMGIGDFSATTIGATLHVFNDNMTMRLSDNCETDQCATPLLEFYRGRNTSLLGRMGFLSSLDNDFSFINNLPAGSLNFGTDATVKLELLASGQARLNQYTSTGSFPGTAAGYLAFDSDGYLVTAAGTGGGGTFLSLTDAPGSYSGQAGQYVRVNGTATGLEFASVSGGFSGYPAVTVDNTNLTLPYDLNSQIGGLFKVELNTRDRYEINVTNPPVNVGAEFAFLFTNVQLGDLVTFPDNFYYTNGSQIGSVEVSAQGVLAEFWYDGTSFWTGTDIGAAAPGTPTCSDGAQNGDETGVDCGGSCPNSCTAPTCSDGIQNGDETGVDCGGSCPPCSGFYPEYQAVLDYATTQGFTLPSAQEQIDQNQIVMSLVDAGTWADLDIFYVFAGDGDSDFAKINWKNPGTHDATIVGTVNYLPNQGFQGDGVTGAINTNWNPSTAVGNYDATTDGQMWFRFHAPLQDREGMAGVRAASTSTSQIMIQTNANSDMGVRLNSNFGTSGTNPYMLYTPNNLATTKDFFVSRESANVLLTYEAGAAAGYCAACTASSVTPNGDLWLLGINTTTTAPPPTLPMDKTISMFALGGGMRPNPDMNELYNAGNVYMNKQ